MNPTDEQLHALDLFRAGDSMVIEAGAGTGKTSTLRLLAEDTPRHGIYTAFNRAVVEDVRASIVDRVDARTIHSLAFAGIGHRYKRRLSSERIRGADVARILDVRSHTIRYGSESKTLQAGFLGSHIMRALAIFCQTADEEPGEEHFPYLDGIDVPDAGGNRTWTNNRALRNVLAPALARAWADVRQPDGRLKFEHGHYLKMWQLEHPRINADFLLLDEAQDLNPVMAAIAAEQDCQRVYVGDSAQAIYGWMGAVNAMRAFDTKHRALLSQSFRFGPMIAMEANTVLEILDTAEDPTPLRLVGLGTIESDVGEWPGTPSAILCRTNACAVSTVFSLMDSATVHLVGGGGEIIRFARGVLDLQTRSWTSHPELACFGSWGEVQEYVAQDPQGDELRLMVRLMDGFGPQRIIDALGHQPAERDADVVVSTAHKAKGREWPIVRVAADFANVDPAPAELRLRYVAYTRAQQHLDNSVMYEEPPVTAAEPPVDES